MGLCTKRKNLRTSLKRKQCCEEMKTSKLCTEDNEGKQKKKYSVPSDSALCMPQGCEASVSFQNAIVFKTMKGAAKERPEARG